MASVLKNNGPPTQQSERPKTSPTAAHDPDTVAKTSEGQTDSTSKTVRTPPVIPPKPLAEALKTTDYVATGTRSGTAGRLPAGKGTDPGGATGLAGFNLDDLAERGREQLKRCQQEIQLQLEQAQQQAEKLRAEAKRLGYEEGLQQAAVDADRKLAQQAEAKARSQLKSLHQAVAAMHTQYDQWMSQYADLLTNTILTATERILRAQLQRDSQRTQPQANPSHESQRIQLDGMTEAESDTVPATRNANPQSISESLIVRWAREALHSTRSASRLTLAVHPDTLAEIGGVLDELLADPDLPEQSTVVPDDTLAVGDVVVRQDGGEIRAGLQAQLARLREELQV